jgi:hypothetical protein
MNGNGAKTPFWPGRGPGRRPRREIFPADQKLNSKSPKSELEAFFNSPYVHNLKEQICEMGHRLWQRAYVDGNGGNMAIRVGEDIASARPRSSARARSSPSDMCLVDFEGNQLCGTKKRTSEVLMHLQMMKHQPRPSCHCHCHPPYATAFAVVGIAPPTCMLPEYEVFAPSPWPRIARPVRRDGQARQPTDRPIQHHSHGQSRRGDLEPQQHRGSLLAHGNRRGLLPHHRRGRPARQADQHLHRPADEGTAQDQAESRLCGPALRHEGMRAVRQRRMASWCGPARPRSPPNPPPASIPKPRRR